MSATAGICGQELLGKGNWWEAGTAQYDMDFLPLLATEFVIMGFFETKRYIGFKETGSVRSIPLHTRFHFQLLSVAAALPFRYPVLHLVLCIPFGARCEADVA